MLWQLDGIVALRRLRGLSQVAVAEALGMEKAEVSAIERRADHRLSTLARYVHGLGGELEVVVRFPEGRIRLDHAALADAVTSAHPASPSDDDVIN